MFGFKKGDGRGRTVLIAALALCGVLLLVFGGSLRKQTETGAEVETSTDTARELAEYRASLETAIAALCTSVEGVGSVTVALTLSGGFCEVYATEATQDGGSKYVIVGSGSGAHALLLSRDAPAIEGIGIVCRGGGDATVRRELTALLSAAYHVPSNRIYITEAKRTAA